MRGERGFALKYACRGLLGDLVDGWLGRVIDLLFVFSIIATITLSFGTMPPMLTNNLSNLLHTGEGFLSCLLIVLAATVIVMLSTLRGLKKGMRVISNATTWGCFLICGLFLVLGSPLFSIENSIQSIGIMLQNYPRMITNMDAIGQSGFPQAWTFFLFSGCICMAPWMWSFIARVSRGRSIKAVVSAILAAGFGGTLLFFGTISNYGIKAYLDGAFSVLENLTLPSANQTISELCLSLPGGKIILAVWFLVALFLLITTMDSASSTLAEATSRATHGQPPRALRAFWAIVIFLPGICLLYAGQFVEGGTPLGGIQSLLFLCGVPVSLIVLLAVASGIRLLWQDNHTKTRDEILREYSLTPKAPDPSSTRPVDL